MNEARSKESWRMVRPWPGAPNRTSWWATSPGRRTECIRTPPGPAPPRAPSTTTTLVASGGKSPRSAPVPGRGHALGRPQRGSRRRVPLGLVVQLDDLGAVEPGRGQRGEAHHEDGTDGEVGGDHAVGPRVPAAGSNAGGSRPGRSPVNPVVPDHGVDAGIGAERQCGPGHVEVGEVDRHLRAGRRQRVQCAGHDTCHRSSAPRRRRLPRRAARPPCSGVGGIDCGHQVEAGPGEDRAAHLATHPSTGADHPDSHGGHPSQGPGAPRDAATGPPPCPPRPPRSPQLGAVTRGRARRRTGLRRTGRRPRACGATRSAPGPQRARPRAVSASTRSRTSSTVSTSPWRSMPAPMRLIRAPESSQASSVSARRFPLAMASSRSVIPVRAQRGELVGDDAEHLRHVLGGRPEPDAEEPGVLVGDPLGPDRVGQARVARGSPGTGGSTARRRGRG